MLFPSFFFPSIQGAPGRVWLSLHECWCESPDLSQLFALGMLLFGCHTRVSTSIPGLLLPGTDGNEPSLSLPGASPAPRALNPSSNPAPAPHPHLSFTLWLVFPAFWGCFVHLPQKMWHQQGSWAGFAGSTRFLRVFFPTHRILAFNLPVNKL